MLRMVCARVAHGLRMTPYASGNPGRPGSWGCPGVLVVKGSDGPGSWGCPGANISNILLSCACLDSWIWAIRKVYADMREGYTQGYARAMRTHGKNIIIFNTILLQDFKIVQRSRHTQGIRRLVIR